jgi:hypothetical protein
MQVFPLVIGATRSPYIIYMPPEHARGKCAAWQHSIAILRKYFNRNNHMPRSIEVAIKNTDCCFHTRENVVFVDNYWGAVV